MGQKLVREIGYIAYCHGIKCYDASKKCSQTSYLRNRVVNALKNHVKSESIRVVNDSYSNVESTTPNCDAKLDIETALSCLDERERDILLKYLVERRTLAEIGREYGLSRTRIHQIVEKSREKVRKRFGSDGGR